MKKKITLENVLEEMRKTSEDIRKEVKLGFQIAKIDLQVEIKELDFRIDKNARQYRDDVLTKMDGVMGELENHRIEQDSLKNDVKNLQGKVEKLERAANVA